MTISGLMAGQLSDGRLQVWASKDGGLFTLWKDGVPADSGWTNWQKQPAETLGVTVGAVAPLENGALHLFVIANAGFNPPFQTGPGVQTTFKLGPESTAGWADWTVFIEGEQARGVGAGASSIAAIPLSDGRLQVFVVMANQNVAKLVTRWKLTTDVSAAWNPTVEMPFAPGEAISRISAGRLSDGRVQLFATAVGSNVFTSWKLTTDSAAAWQPWQLFYSGSDDDQITAASLPDGRMQLWRLNRNGALWSRWKVAVDSSAAWTEWQAFPTPSSRATVFTAAPLSDGRLQLFLADETGAMFSSWKADTNPDAAWTPWAPFPSP